MPNGIHTVDLKIQQSCKSWFRQKETEQLIIEYNPKIDTSVRLLLPIYLFYLHTGLRPITCILQFP